MTYREVIATLSACFWLATVGCVSNGSAPLNAVDQVDLAQYAGKWYEIASFPQSFQRGCVATTAEYTLLENGRVRVVNECRDGALDGDLRRVEGTARVVDPDTNAKLAVQFFWPFEGPYWIIELAPDYSYAVVSEPTRNALWILSRTPTMDESLLQEIIARRAADGFDVTRLQRTLQAPAS